jgi:hypothetical protein
MGVLRVRPQDLAGPNKCGDYDGAVRVVGELALDTCSPFDTEQMAKASLAMIVLR